MVRPRLIAITDLTRLEHAALVGRMQALARAALPGSLAILLRDHAASARQRLALGRELRAICSTYGQALWVADRLDLAVLLDADGLHLGESSVSATVARGLLGPSVFISRAWHQPLIEPGTELCGVDGLLLSPILQPRKTRPALGVGALAKLRRALDDTAPRVALFALGGVDSLSSQACLDAGAQGVAAIGAVLVGDYRALLHGVGALRPV
jgi:thiamine-phosphate pyrophosphorylase